MQTDNEIKIQQAIEAMMPDKLGNGLNRTQARILYMGENNVFMTDRGLFTKDRRLNEIPVEQHIKTYVERFGIVKPDEMSVFTKRSEVEDYCEKNNIPLSEQAGYLARAMKNEGFNLNA